MMMTLLTTIQRNILAFALIVVFIILIYVLWLWIKKERQHAKKTKFMVLDNVISYKKMKKLIQYHVRQGEERPFSLMMVTIDHFDQILDYADSETTTEYIQRVGKLLEITLPLGAKLAQMEDRESFIICIPERPKQDVFLNIGQSFKNMAEKRIELNDGNTIEKSASVALINYPDHALNMEELIQGLKTTTYAIKKRGGNDILFYSIDMLEEKKNYQTYQVLKNAIKNKDIETQFSPIYDLESKYMIGAEIDTLWHKETSQEHFKDFMPSLETSKDSYWFELWLLEKALSSHVSMIGINNHKRYELMIPAGVRQFENEMITEDIMHILDKYALEGDQLIFKIINPLQVNQETQFIKSLIDLQSYGIKLAVDISKIDDNLYYLLNEYKIDILLIDHLLLTTNHDKQIEVEELINFVKANQLEMIVTGIQEKQQLSKLDDEIVKIQGPLLSVPLSKDQILNHLNKRLEI